MKRLAPVFSAFIFAVGCGDDSGSLPNVSGVWSGSYSGILGTAAGNSPKGSICLEMSQGGATLYGKGFMSGKLWNGDFNGTISGSRISFDLSGKDTTSRNVNVHFSGTATSNRIEGTVIVTIGNQSFSYDVTLNKQTGKSSCGWADRSLVLAFANALGQASGNAALGSTFASFITEVPRVDVSVDAATYRDWWICIWEVRDNTGGTPSEYTLGGVIDPSNVQRFAGWYIGGTPPNIGLDSSRNSRSVNKTLGSALPDTAIYVDPLGYTLTPDGTGDSYTNSGTIFDPSKLFYVSECMGGKRYSVYMTSVPFTVFFDGLSTDSINHSFRVSSGTAPVPALYVEINSCP